MNKELVECFCFKANPKSQTFEIFSLISKQCLSNKSCSFFKKMTVNLPTFDLA